MVWWCEENPPRGPLPAVVVASRGDELDLAVLGPGPGYARGVTPWGVEDGTNSGWLDIPPDGVVPSGLFG